MESLLVRLFYFFFSVFLPFGISSYVAWQADYTIQNVYILILASPGLMAISLIKFWSLISFNQARFASAYIQMFILMVMVLGTLFAQSAIIILIGSGIVGHISFGDYLPILLVAIDVGLTTLGTVSEYQNRPIL
jgi:hypothetical protein